MILGSCPYCDSLVQNAMPAESPGVISSVCESCGKKYWLYFSRMGKCLAYTQEEFDKEYVVNESDKSVRRAR